MLQLDDSVWASMVARARRHHDHVAARIIFTVNHATAWA